MMDSYHVFLTYANVKDIYECKRDYDIHITVIVFNRIHRMQLKSLTKRNILHSNTHIKRITSHNLVIKIHLNKDDQFSFFIFQFTINLVIN